MELLRLIERASQHGWPGYRDVETGQFIPAFTGAKGDVSVPPETDEERELKSAQLDIAREQLALAKEQRQQAKELEPILLRSMGIQRDPTTGQLAEGFTPEQERSRQITQLQQERSLAALRGELPVSPTLEREIAAGANMLRERMARQLGPGWETSTPGIQAMREFEAQSEALREAERRDQLTTAETLGLAREGQRTATSQSYQQVLQANKELLGSSYLRAGRTTGEALNPYQARTAMALRAKTENARASQAETAGYVQGGMTIGALGLAYMV